MHQLSQLLHNILSGVCALDGCAPTVPHHGGSVLYIVGMLPRHILLVQRQGGHRDGGFRGGWCTLMSSKDSSMRRRFRAGTSECEEHSASALPQG